MCICPPQWTGENCTDDVDECRVISPCQNNATCVNLLGSYLCVCGDFLAGINCTEDVLECSLDTPVCQNNGTCQEQFGLPPLCGCMEGKLVRYANMPYIS